MSKIPPLIHGIVGSHNVPMNLIYGLIDPRTRLIRYIGQSSVGTKRPKQHAKSATDTYCRNWIRSLQRLRLTYEIIILDILDDASELDEGECWWIVFGRVCGWPLTNLTEGGVPSAETLTKRTERQKRNAERTERNAAVRQRKTEERQRTKATYEAASAERLRNFRLTIYSPAQLTAMKRGKAERSQSQRSPAEIEQRVFKLFEQHAENPRMFIDVVIGARVTPDTARWLHEKWLTSKSRGAFAMARDREELRRRLALEYLRALKAA